MSNFLETNKIVKILETVQNSIVVVLSVGLFGVMVIRLFDLFVSLIVPIEFEQVTSDILFILILVEIFRLLIIYLQDQRISVGVAVEVSIVSVLREVIIRGALEIPWQQILAICILLLVLGTLLLIRAWMAKIFNTIDIEKAQALADGHLLNDDDEKMTNNRTI